MSDTFTGWFIVEQMGHKRLVGFVSEHTIAGKGFLRIDVPNTEGEENQITQFISPDTIYAITPTTEELARQAALLNCVRPITRYDLPAPSLAKPEPPAEYIDPFAREDDDDWNEKDDE